MISIDIHKELSGPTGKMELSIQTEIPAKSFVTLYGPSGSGKTSLLRILAGLLKPNKGRIVLGNEVIFDSSQNINWSPQQRMIGLVFQDYALFPNMTVLQNLKIALPKNSESSVINELLQVMELSALIDRRPDTLSGGQKQRVALARALVAKPKVLLLDEPLSALDLTMRQKLQSYLLTLHNKYQLCTILVSHDIGEITKTSDLILKINEGKIVQKGEPHEVLGYRNLSGKFKFTGEIIRIQEEEFIYIFHILIGNEMVRVVGDSESAKELNIGDKVVVASKAFNPIIQKIK